MAELEPCPTQGPTRYERVDWLVENWIPEAMRPLKVYRRDGKWFIRNGRHRWLAARRLGLEWISVEADTGPARPWWDSTLRFWVDGEDPHPQSGYGARGAMDNLAPKYGTYPRRVEPGYLVPPPGTI